MHFIFEVHVKPGHTAEQYAQAWVRASEIIQQASGARGTRLHRKIGDPMILLAIASWDSKEQRDAMESEQPEVVRQLTSEAATVASAWSRLRLLEEELFGWRGQGSGP